MDGIDRGNGSEKREKKSGDEMVKGEKSRNRRSKIIDWRVKALK